MYDILLKVLSPYFPVSVLSFNFCSYFYYLYLFFIKTLL